MRIIRFNSKQDVLKWLMGGGFVNLTECNTYSLIYRVIKSHRMLDKPLQMSQLCLNTFSCVLWLSVLSSGWALICMHVKNPHKYLFVVYFLSLYQRCEYRQCRQSRCTRACVWGEPKEGTGQQCVGKERALASDSDRQLRHTTVLKKELMFN